MPCSSIRERLDEFIDAELPADLDTEVREHLAVCERCRLEIDHQRAFLGRIRRIELAAAPDEVRERVRAALSGQARQG